MNSHPLEEVAKIFSGNSINAKLKKEKYTDKDFSTPYVATKDLNKNGDFEYNNGVTIPAVELDKFKIAPKGSTLICMEGGSAGKKIGLVDKDVCFVNKLGALVPNEKINSRYLYYSLQTIEFQSQFQSSLTGIIGGVSLSKFKKLKIPVPSLQEQEKIVDRLDKVFKTSDTSIKLKKSIINEFISYYNLNINNFFTQLEEEITLSDFVNDSKNDIVDGPFGSNLKREHFVSRGIEVLKLQDIKENNIYKKSKDYVSKDRFLELKRHSFKPNDLILTKLGNPLGVCAIVKDNEGLIVADLLRVRCKNLLDAKFLMYQINSMAFKKKINSFQRGATRPRIRISDFRNIKIKTCSTKEKKEIVELVEKLDSLKSKYLSNNNLLTNNYLDLKTSVLNEEFVYE